MTRVIDADKFKNNMDYVCDAGGWLEPVTKAVTEYVKKQIDAQPTVDIELVRHGKWIMKSDPFGFFDEIPVCSECGCTTKMREKTKFCPHCGAKMGDGHGTD